MADLAGDEEILVWLVGIEMMTDFLLIIKKEKVENDYVPNIEKMFVKAIDPITADEIRIRMA